MPPESRAHSFAGLKVKDFLQPLGRTVLDDALPELDQPPIRDADLRRQLFGGECVACQELSRLLADFDYIHRRQRSIILLVDTTGGHMLNSLKLLEAGHRLLGCP